MRKKKSFKRIIKHKILRKRNLLSLITIILIIIFTIFISILNIVPIKYIILTHLILLLITIIGTILINVHEKTVLKIIGIIILIFSTISCCVGLYYIKSTYLFLHDSFDNSDIYIKNTYYVLSKRTNNYRPSDIADEVSIYQETINLSEATSRLNDKYDFREKRYDNLEEQFNNLNNDTDKFLLIDKTNYEIIFNISNTIDKSDYTILYEYDVYTKRRNSHSKEKESFNIFVGGTDFAGLMDFNTIITVNVKEHEILLTSIPKDYYIENADKKGTYDKLSYMNSYGVDTNKKSLEALLDIDIDYEVLVDTNSLVKIVDYLGGINYCSKYSYTTTHALVTDSYDDSGKKLTINKGCQHLDGLETLTVARESNALKEKDKERQENCQQIMISILKKILSKTTLLKYNETLENIELLYKTDIPKDIIDNIIKDLLNNGNIWNIKTQSVEGNIGYDRVHLTDIMDTVIYPDYNTINSASKKIKDIIK